MNQRIAFILTTNSFVGIFTLRTFLVRLNRSVAGLRIAKKFPMVHRAGFHQEKAQQQRNETNRFPVSLPPSGRRDHQLNEGSIGGPVQRFNDIRIGGSLQFHAPSKPDNARFHKQKAFSYV